MNAQDWSRIAPDLERIERYASHLANDAKSLQLAAQSLNARPAWETLAREKLNEAERDLMLALAVVRGARDVYDRLPVIVETWNQAAE